MSEKRRPPKHNVLGVKLDSRDAQYLVIKRNGLTITIQKDEPDATIKGFAERRQKSRKLDNGGC